MSNHESTGKPKLELLQSEGAEAADPQDLHDVVKAVLPEVQFLVGPGQTPRQSTSRRG